MAAPAFVKQLNEQLGNEFGAHQQYVAIATYFDALTMPQMAALFYQQALEERDHAMMMVQYLLDTDEPVRIPGVEAPEAGFADVIAPVKLALAQEFNAIGDSDGARTLIEEVIAEAHGDLKAKAQRLLAEID